MLATSAQAALLINVEGAVSINRGDGYRPVAENGAPLVAGDRVRSGLGSADIVYENGCSQKVGPNQTMIVLSPAPACNVGLKDGASVSEGGGVSTEVVVLGGLVAGGAVGLGLALSNSTSHSVSP